MSALVERKYELKTTGAKEQKHCVVGVSGRNHRPAGDSRPRMFRKRKVFAVRRELAEGRYAVNERLSVAFDRLIEDIMMAGGTRAQARPRQIR